MKACLFITLTLVLGFNTSLEASTRSVISSKSFQWVRGQLWSYGPRPQHNEDAVQIAKVDLPDIEQTKKEKNKPMPEELTKALEKASRQRL